MKQIKRIIFMIIVLVSMITINLQAAVFSQPMKQFIQDGKMVRVMIKDGLTSILLTPLKDMDLYDLKTKSSVKLVKGENYFIKLDYFLDETDGTYWKIQTFATHDQVKAQVVKDQLIVQGYNDLQIITEHDWYKVQLGRYFLKEQAEQVARGLEKDGWQTWVISKNKRDRLKTIGVYNANGEPLFKGRDLALEGIIKLDEGLYPGKIEFLRNEKGFDIYNTVNLVELLEGILATEFTSDEQRLFSALKAQAVVTRTQVFYELFNYNGGSLKFSSYQGIDQVNDLIKEAVNSTAGEVLKYYGEIINPAFSQQGALTMAVEGADYQEILKRFYQQYYDKGLELVELTKIVQDDLVVDAEVQWGLNYREIRQLTWWGPRVITVLDLDLNRPGYSIEPFLANDQLLGLADLQEVVKKEGALAGINGGFFVHTGYPLGLLMKNGQIISEPIKMRTAVGITCDHKILFDRVKWQGIVSDEEEVYRIKVVGVNRQPHQDEIVLINKYYGDKAPKIKEDMQEVVIVRGRVESIHKGKDKEGTSIPKDGFILQAHGQAKRDLKKLQIGAKVNFKNDFTPDWEENDLVSALGAGPTLIKDGKIFITAKGEAFRSDIVYGRAPRSALGLTAAEHFVLITIDGRQPGLSMGISLQELAQFMLDYGIVEGMNLDGGGSAQMVVRGLTMNNPSAQRLISNGLLIKFAEKGKVF